MSKLKPRDKAGRKKVAADVARAQAAADVAPAEPDGKPLVATRAALRGRYARRPELQRVFDEFATVRPGAESLSLVAGCLAVQVTEEQRLMAECLTRLEALPTADEDQRDELAATVGGIREQLQEHRRCTRHLVAVSAALAKAVKVAFDTRILGGVDNVQVRGTSSLRSHLTTPDDATVN